MAKFKYTLPSGAKFTLEAPADTTQLQADRIFYEQVAAGALVGYTTGQTLTSTASIITKFELSRLDRGTAGVDNVAILSIIQNLPVTTGIPSLVEVPLTNPITQADVILIKGDGLGSNEVGPLSDYEVQVLQAQIANLVDQDYNIITKEKGIGQYGFTCYQLEKAGYIKPGTTARFMDVNPDQFVNIMYSPGIWTGLSGIVSLDDLLYNDAAQNRIQTELMEQAYDSLVATGVISGVPSPAISVSNGTVYTQTGLQSLSLLSILSGSGLSLGNLSALSTGAIATPNFTGLANSLTTQITGNVGALIANASKFGTSATALWSTSSGLGSLSSLTTGVSTLSAGALTSLASAANLTKNLTNLVPGSLTNLTSSLNLLGKASQFSINFANPLSNVQGLANKALSNVQGLATNALGSVQGLATNALGSVQGLAGSLTSKLSGIAGGLQGALGSFGGAFGGGDLVSGTQVAAGFTNTVKRATVDAAVTRILGNSKITPPQFELPSTASLGNALDISQAQNILSGLKNQASGIANQVTNRVSGITNQASGLVSQTNRIIG